MTFFKDCKTIEEVKALYRTLAKQYHPDRGGDTATMQALNNEYAFACAKIAKGQNMSQQETDSAILNAEAYRQALEKVIGIDGLYIELVGAWIWITGNTYPNRAEIKAAGFQFASNKKAWFFRSEEYKAPNKGANLSLDQIKNKYGSQLLTHTSKSYQNFLAK